MVDVLYFSFLTSWGPFQALINRSYFIRTHFGTFLEPFDKYFQHLGLHTPKTLFIFVYKLFHDAPFFYVWSLFSGRRLPPIPCAIAAPSGIRLNLPKPYRHSESHFPTQSACVFFAAASFMLLIYWRLYELYSCGTCS